MYFSVRWENVVASTRSKETNESYTARITRRWESLGGLKVSLTAAEVPNGTVKITHRMVAPGIGLSWGGGVLSYKGRDYPFTFKATGLFRDVDAKITAAELSGHVSELKRLEDFSGNYKKVESKDSGQRRRHSRHLEESKRRRCKPHLHGRRTQVQSRT